ncbi:MAG: hypothetical protein IIA88_02270 [Bacteroidetes bacterium]|nr:hypothetical protein [Bacteroidota bacterium]
MKNKQIPFDFVLDYLYPKVPEVKPMFGCYAVYINEKIIFILRNREEYPEDNGVWLATTKEHHESLGKDFPSMRSIKAFGPGVSGWQVLPCSSDEFESSVILACELVLKEDSRIGKTPKSKYQKDLY